MNDLSKTTKDPLSGKKTAEIYEEQKLNHTARVVVNIRLSELTTPGGEIEYFDLIPLDKIAAILKEHGLILINGEELTEREVFAIRVAGETGKDFLPLADIETAEERNGRVVYNPIVNSELTLQWDQMPTGKHKITTYLS
jgi:hypothetical protein